MPAQHDAAGRGSASTAFRWRGVPLAWRPLGMRMRAPTRTVTGSASQPCTARQRDVLMGLPGKNVAVPRQCNACSRARRQAQAAPRQLQECRQGSSAPTAAQPAVQARTKGARDTRAHLRHSVLNKRLVERGTNQHHNRLLLLVRHRRRALLLLLPVCCLLRFCCCWLLPLLLAVVRCLLRLPCCWLLLLPARQLHDKLHFFWVALQGAIKPNSQRSVHSACGLSTLPHPTTLPAVRPPLLSNPPCADHAPRPCLPGSRRPLHPLLPHARAAPPPPHPAPGPPPQ